ncbi:hypothetical protein MMC11_005056 [Xylographa trunciseda]|nr:hypothetical protein [Xylographa trunciseda]
MATFGDPNSSATSDWCITDLCWDSASCPCTFPSSCQGLPDITTWGEVYQSSPTPDLVPSAARALNSVSRLSSTAAKSSISGTTCAFDGAEYRSSKAKMAESSHELPLQAAHGHEKGLKSPLQKARRRRRNVKQVFQDHWEQHRSTIKHLYLDEEKCLEDVMQYMQEQFGFSEKMPAYKRMLSLWGFTKNIPASHMSILAAKARKRRADEGKETHFYVHERLLDPSKFIRFTKREPVEGENDVAIGSATPPHVRYVTPPSNSCASNKSPNQQDSNYSFYDIDSSVVQTPEGPEMIHRLTQDCLQDPRTDDLSLSLIGMLDNDPKRSSIPKHTVYITGWEGHPYDEPITRFSPDFTDAVVLENNTPLKAKAQKHTPILIPRFPCGIFKPPVDIETIPQQKPNKAVLHQASIFDKESSGSRYQDSKPQNRNGRPSTVHSCGRLSRIQQDSLSTTVAALEKVRDMILCQYGPKNEIFLQQCLGLGLIYEELSKRSKCDMVIANLGTGYNKFCLPVDGSQWTQDDLINASLPLSEYICCSEPVLEHCTCDQLRAFAKRNRARMSWRFYISLQSRAIACYLRSGTTGEALDSLLNLEDIFDPLVMEGYLQPVFEILETYSINDLNCSRLLPFLNHAVSIGNNKQICERTYTASCRLWMTRNISLAGHLSLVTTCAKVHSHPPVIDALVMTEDQLLQQIDKSKGNDFLTQIRIMRDVRILTNHYEDHGSIDTARTFVLRMCEKCRNSWGRYHSETLQAQELMQVPCTGRPPQGLLEPGLYNGSKVFDRSFG